MKVHFVIHEAFEAPGAYETWARGRGHDVSFTRLYDGERLPISAQDHDMLIVMGGPQSPATTTDECPHFDAAAERGLIARFVEAGKPVVGICLGSQLIGEALGAAHGHSPEKEIGKFPISLTPEGQANPKFTDFGAELAVGHWHNDMPGLTATATIIAASEGCPRQIVEYGDLVYGFQCHMEFTPDVIELLIAASEAELATLTDYRFVQQPDALRDNDYSEMNSKLFGFLDKLEAAYVARQGATDPGLDVQQHIASVLAFYAVAERLKRELRHSWISDGRQESVAEHSWMMSLLAILMADKLAQPIDTGKTLKMVVVHDLVESIAGDIPYFEVSDRKANKAALEAAAMDEIVRLLPVAVGHEIRSLFEEFEARETTEAKFASALDTVEVQLQHNLAALDTWIPREFDLVYTKVSRPLAHDPYLSEFAAAVIRQAEEKMVAGGIDIAALRQKNGFIAS